MLTVVNKDGTFSGVQYESIKQKYIDHHRQYGQKLVWTNRLLTFDEDGNVNETPTEAELLNEITDEPTFNEEQSLVVAEMYEELMRENMTLSLALADVYEELQEIKGGN